VLVGHGSRVPGFERAMRRAARALEKRLGETPVHPAFLEINAPTIGEAVDACVAAGARTVKILPYFLLTGRHVREHIPQMARAARKRHRGRAKIVLCPYLGFNPKIVDVLLQRVRSRR
jgi:sirohydrochlorin cobaltochelatase